jgi:soluble lytic murein transglycosylase
MKRPKPKILNIFLFLCAVVLIVPQLISSSSHTIDENKKRKIRLIEHYRSGEYHEIIRSVGKQKEASVDEVLLAAKAFEKMAMFNRANRIYRELYVQKPSTKYFYFYLIARNFEREGNIERAVKWYLRVLSEVRKYEVSDFDHTSIVYAVLYRLYLYSSVNRSAKRGLLRYKNYFPAALYYLAKLHQDAGDYRKASDYYIKIFSANEKSLKIMSLKEIAKERRVVQYLIGRSISAEKLTSLYLKYNLYVEALDILFLFDEKGWVLEKRALCHFSLREFQTALQIYSDYYEVAGKSDALLKMAYAYFYMGNNEAAGRTLKEYLNVVQSQSQESGIGNPLSADTRYLRIQLEKNALPVKQYLKLVGEFVYDFTDYAKSDRLVLSAFYYALARSKNQEAVQFLKNVNSSLTGSFYRVWASYILGVYYDRSNFQEALILRPGSYYYFRTSEILLEDNEYSRADSLIDADRLYESGDLTQSLVLYLRFYGTNPKNGNIRKRIHNILLRIEGRGETSKYLYGTTNLDDGVLYQIFLLGFYDDLEEIIESGLPLGSPDIQMRFHYLLSKIHYEKGNIVNGIHHAERIIEGLNLRYALFLNEGILKLLYPTAYLEVIKTQLSLESKEYDPLLVLSVIREESRYNSQARSSKGALGLMQLMPDTASWIERETVPEDDLFDPAVNIHAGIKYLVYLFDRFDRIEHVLAAYNGGPNNVAKWLRSSSGKSIEEFIEEIPFSETRNFVKKVMTTYSFYRELYQNN